MAKNGKSLKPVPVKDIYTVEEFCKLMCIGKTLYYKLRAERKGPRVMKLGRSVRISREEVEAWRSRRTGVAK